MTGRYFQDWLLLPTDWNWRLRPDRGGALRAVGDIGSHWLDLMTFVTGHRIVEVMADLATFIPVRQEPTGPVETFSTERSARPSTRAIQTEDAASILLRFDNGARGSVTRLADQPRPEELARLGDRRLRGLARLGLRESRPDLGGPSRAPERDPHQEPGAHGRRPAGPRRRCPGGHVEGFADTFAALFRAIHADVALGRPSARPAYPTFADGHDEMLVNDAIAESARTGCWVAVARDPALRRATACDSAS